MNNIQVACYALIAAAFILAGLLLVQLQGRMIQNAKAEMVIGRQNFTVLTTRTKNDEEAVFVLNNTTDRLLVYRADIGRKRLELVGNEDVGRLFGVGGGGRDNDGRRSR